MHHWNQSVYSLLKETKKKAYEVSISTVRSVSGFAMDVLKLGPLCTVNHCDFLNEQGGMLRIIT